MKFTRKSAAHCRALMVTLLASLVLVSLAASAAGPKVHRLTTKQYAPTQTIDVLSSAPDKPFVRIAKLTVDNPTGSASRSQLVAELSNTAQSLGANALVVEHVTRAVGGNLGFNPSGGQMQGQTRQPVSKVTALAIRYTH